MQSEIPYFCIIDIWFRIPFPFLFPFAWSRFRIPCFSVADIYDIYDIY